MSYQDNRIKEIKRALQTKIITQLGINNLKRMIKYLLEIIEKSK